MSPDLGTATRPAPTGPDHLWERLHRVEQRVRTAVRERRADDPDPDDPYRGQYLGPEAVERILAASATVHGGRAAPEGAHPRNAAAGDSPAPPPGSRLARLSAAFGLLPVDLDLLLVALAPDLDTRFEQLYGYLNDDLTRRRATIGLALELCGLPGAGAGRSRFSVRAPLIAGGLLEVGEPERPLLSRTLRVPDRVTAHLLGDDEPDGALAGVARRAAPEERPWPGVDRPAADRLRAVAACGGPVHLLDRAGTAGPLAVAALAADGPPPLVVDAAALAARPAGGVVRVLAREARLAGCGVVLGPLDRLEPERPERAALVRELCAELAGAPSVQEASGRVAVPLVVHGPQVWDPAWARESPVVVTVPPPNARDRTEQWARALAGESADGALPPELAEAVAAYRVDQEQLERAAAVAARTAAAERRPVRAEDLRTAVRAQNGAGLARLARRIEPAVGWADLVLPEPTAGRLRELVLRARHRDQVLGQWRMRPGGGRGNGVIALFAGESGTGKTMSAEVVAAELGMELYVVDLSTVVDKYIGETEKNLERIFTEASQVNGVLLFDEADALFGKRSQVKDAHDRHANVETAYLLQRMESFEGIALLTSNLRANLDEAFTRRLDVIADFPLPDEAQRRVLWDRCLGPRLPRGDDLDLDFCARNFELTGGSIRACAVSAAYLAAGTGAPLGMAQLVAAVVGEYRKLGRLVLESEFGPWLGIIGDAGRG
ncbi:ATPase family protein associated with various cellular activities (AAA) [Streptomyces sp. 1114.5]|uniref:ATP-binding protein n=1 Tax=unclassified Streptomyces TaxID=2593676 RepID=UPI000BC55D40|nr:MULTISPECIES: ATP-binding protein [unclassified Streptomyces]RKT12252.1 ATPase family protein associated with various cellular activities (AAA) [Streptomyces sp. 1114.5]SOB79583.1 ATPase family associated with various cellular activities (AAA) [Streptomyces sp. 1331.2]